MEYIFGQTNKSNLKLTLLAGLYADISPLGQENDVYFPLNIVNTVYFYDRGIPDNEPMNFNGIEKSFSFRFANVKFVMIIWKEEVEENDIEIAEDIINRLFPYSKIPTNGEDIVLERCNSLACNITPAILCGYVGINYSDLILDKYVPNLDESQKKMEKRSKKIRF